MVQISELRLLMKDALEVGREGKAHETSLRQLANEIEKADPTLEPQDYGEQLQEKRDYIIDNQQCALCGMLACSCRNAAKKAPCVIIDITSIFGSTPWTWSWTINSAIARSPLQCCQEGGFCFT